MLIISLCHYYYSIISHCVFISVVKTAVKTGDLESLKKVTKSNFALHVALGMGHPKAVEMLIKYGASVASPDALGVSPLCKAAKGGLEVCVEMLVQAGALHTACTQGDEDTVRAVLQAYGHKYLIVRHNDKLPLDVARCAGKDSIVKMIALGVIGMFTLLNKNYS